LTEPVDRARTEEPPRAGPVAELVEELTPTSSDASDARHPQRSRRRGKRTSRCSTSSRPVEIVQLDGGEG